MMGDHGGFAHDDNNEMLLVANPSFTPQTVSVEAQTIQVAPTLVEALGLNPTALDALKIEGTSALAVRARCQTPRPILPSALDALVSDCLLEWCGQEGELEAVRAMTKIERSFTPDEFGTVRRRVS